MHASSVFSSSMAMVMGPTPPGTGVRNAATPSTSAASTSPTSRYHFFFDASSTALMPTLTTAPRFSQAPLTKLGLPHAPTTMSASRTLPAMSAVREWQMVKVAFLCISRSEMGRPTIFTALSRTPISPISLYCSARAALLCPSACTGRLYRSRNSAVVRRNSTGGSRARPWCSGCAKSNFSLRCAGSGCCSRMPWLSAREFKVYIHAWMSAELDPSDNSYNSEVMPASSHALRFPRTHVWEWSRVCEHTGITFLEMSFPKASTLGEIKNFFMFSKPRDL